METKTLDIFGHTPEELFKSLRAAIDEAEKVGATDFDIITTWSQIAQAYVGQLTYVLYE